MNVNWSKYIQTTEELYRSRDMRFNEQNKDIWLNAIGAKSGDNILEIGCAGGVFCHKLKQYVPNISITGVDLDSAHIEYAKSKSKETGVQFINADATSLPFGDNVFDLCYSYTVSEHIPHEPFFKEQYRVLKNGGRIVVLSVRKNLGVKNIATDISETEQRLIEKAWSKAGKNRIASNVGIYEMDEHDYPKQLEKYGFKDVNVNMFTIVDYAPDNFLVSDEMAVEQINIQRMHSICSVQKALNINSDALSKCEYDTLIELINKRFDKRINQYKCGEKLWDFSSSTVLAVNGVK